MYFLLLQLLIIESKGYGQVKPAEKAVKNIPHHLSLQIQDSQEAKH